MIGKALLCNIVVRVVVVIIIVVIVIVVAVVVVVGSIDGSHKFLIVCVCVLTCSFLNLRRSSKNEVSR